MHSRPETRDGIRLAALSPRARPGALVPMPLNWRQVRAGLDSMRFRLLTARAALLRAQPWQDFDAAQNALGAAAWRLSVR